MLAWRAAGYCLRELFGDVLGGIRDEFEVHEIDEVETMRDITPEKPALPPKPPAPPAPPAKAAEPVEAAPVTEPTEPEFNLGDFLEQIETGLAGAKDDTDVAEIWNDFDAPAVLETNGHADMIDTAFAIRDRRLAQLAPLNGG
ncbi:hypothetical protein [Ensifer sp. 22564]|uniref:hypothetical protein n=1 Tax=unclassified Ensifer TaxID=2633371 RepID=UPI003F873F0E